MMRELQTPCYVIDMDRLKKNLEILKGVSDRTGCRILLAQKAFSAYRTYPLIGSYLAGATASGLYEAKLCKEEMPKHMENHIFSPAFQEKDFAEICEICDHIVFNSVKQLKKFGERAKMAGLQVGLRINPEKSTQEGHAIYDPCAPGSRLGVTLAEWQQAYEQEPVLLSLPDGFHFHTLCEQNADALLVTLKAVEEKFGPYLAGKKWINFGGGHHITRTDYDVPALEGAIRHMQEKYGLLVYLEPGEAVALNAGYLYTTVLEVQEKSAAKTACVAPPADKPGGMDAGSKDTGRMDIVILDTSAACHMPDVLEMPYRPPLRESGEEGEKAFTYRLAGPTCLAGDVIGTYSFDRKLQEGDRLVFEDMAIYSMVKNNTFNGMPLPSVYLKEGDRYTLWKSFTYEDFKSRL